MLAREALIICYFVIFFKLTAMSKMKNLVLLTDSDIDLL